MLTHGQRNDALGYMAFGTTSLCALGGIGIGLTALVLVGCGLGALINQQASVGDSRTLDEDVESKLTATYGNASVAKYRECRASGMTVQVAARQVIYEELQRRE